MFDVYNNVRRFVEQIYTLKERSKHLKIVSYLLLKFTL